MLATRISILALAAGFAASAAVAQTLTGTVGSEVTIVETPGDDATVIATLPAETSLTVAGCTPDGTWCQVDSAGTIGWVRADAVNVTADGQTYVLSQRPSTVTVETIEGDQDTGAAGGFVAGAAIGAAAGGPVGAAAGAVVGALSGAAVSDPDERVITYTTENPVPSVIYEGDLQVGAVLPETITLTPVPESDFSYVYVDNTPVVVDSSHRVVRIIE